MVDTIMANIFVVLKMLLITSKTIMTEVLTKSDMIIDY